MKYKFIIPTGATIRGQASHSQLTYSSVVLDRDFTVDTDLLIYSGDIAVLRIEAFLILSTDVANGIKLQFAQITPDVGDITIKANSIFRITKI